MNTDLNNKPVQEIWVHTEDGEFSIQSGNNQTLNLSATYHGDHDEFWIIHKIAGREVARFNCKYISRIVWL